MRDQNSVCLTPTILQDAQVRSVPSGCGMLAPMPDQAAPLHHLTEHLSHPVGHLAAVLTLSNAVVLVLVVVLLGCAVVFFRSRNPRPWTAILVAAVAAGACFTVGGESATDSAGPSVATVFAGIVGTLCVVAWIIALVPRSADAPPRQAPSLLASSAVVLGAVGLLLNIWFG